MMCFSEQQKEEIVHTGIQVIEFKRSIVKANQTAKEVIEIVRDMLLKLVDGISKSLQVIRLPNGKAQDFDSCIFRFDPGSPISTLEIEY